MDVDGSERRGHQDLRGVSGAVQPAALQCCQGKQAALQYNAFKRCVCVCVFIYIIITTPTIAITSYYYNHTLTALLLLYY